jgi:isopenicillin N synthase-like dioxygenase
MQMPKQFDMQEEKHKLSMANRPFFTGYTALENEIIRAKAYTAPEQFDFAHEHDFEWSEDDENWKKCEDQISGLSTDLTSDPWLPAHELPTFATFSRRNEVTSFSGPSLHLILEALDLPPKIFEPYADPIDDDYSRLKTVKYAPVAGWQGCGPH